VASQTEPSPLESGPTRRQFLRNAGLGVAGVAIGGPVLAACKGSSGAAAASSSSGGTLKIGFVSPRTGPAAGFGEPDAYVLGLARKAFAGGLSVGGKHYAVTIIDKDGQSDPARGAQVANDLIHSDQVDLMLTTSTPETVNPVSDACEAAGVPCVSTVVPWEAWYFGRGAKAGAASPFKFTYHFCFGVQQFFNAYTTMWPQVTTNKKIGVMWPNDADGNAIRSALGPLLQKAGYTIVDPGAYTDGATDYSSQIAKFKAEDCQIFNTFPIPPDFATFWQQASQQGYKPKVAQVAKTGLFPSQVEALGAPGVGLAGGEYWGPTWPYSSSLAALTSQQLGDGYQTSSGKQWNQQLGPSMALFDVASALFKTSSDPKDKAGVAKTMATLQVNSVVGKLEWGKGPVANVVATPIIGGQWVKGTKYPLDFVVCENSSDKNVPVAAKLQPYGA
jgi:branched-chain amino acid transport system substrate-binding protein